MDEIPEEFSFLLAGLIYFMIMSVIGIIIHLLAPDFPTDYLIGQILGGTIGCSLGILIAQSLNRR